MSPNPSNFEFSRDQTGLLLIGHGTRNVSGRDEFLQTVSMLRERLPRLPIEPGFLELCDPDISTGMDRLVSAGVTRIIAAPVLLLAAGHARHDIPEALSEAARRHDGVIVQQAPHLGCHAALLDLSRQRFLEALGDGDAGNAGSTSPNPRIGWLMVGRGSKDESALAEMRRFVELRLRETAVDYAVTCFLAMAQPRLEDAIQEMASADVTHVVAQPHLLFPGDLLGRLSDTVEAARQRHADKVWLLTEHLGPSPQLVETIIARSQEA